MKHHFFLFVFVIPGLAGCGITNDFAAPDEVKTALSLCFRGQDTGLQAKLPLQGYYTVVTERKYSYEWEEYSEQFIFYADGTVLEMTPLQDGNCDYKKPHEIARAYQISERFPDSRLNFQIYKFGEWGLYSLKGNVLTVQTVHRKKNLQSAYDHWRVSSRIFKITDENVLIEPLPESVSGTPVRNKPSGSRFTPLDVVPKPWSYLHEKSWFRCR